MANNKNANYVALREGGYISVAPPPPPPPPPAFNQTSEVTTGNNSQYAYTSTVNSPKSPK